MPATPFHDGLIVVFATAVGLSLPATAASLLRGASSAPTITPQPQEVP